MKKISKRLLTFTLVFAMLFSMCGNAFAETARDNISNAHVVWLIAQGEFWFNYSSPCSSNLSQGYVVYNPEHYIKFFDTEHFAKMDNISNPEVYSKKVRASMGAVIYHGSTKKTTRQMSVNSNPPLTSSGWVWDDRISSGNLKYTGTGQYKVSSYATFTVNGYDKHLYNNLSFTVK